VKTAAFGIPCWKNDCGIGLQSGVVLGANPELAIQVAEELNKIGHLNIFALFPSMDGRISTIKSSIEKPPQIKVGTRPFMDHMRRKTTVFAVVSFVSMKADEC
jgi:ATP-dependent RNA helicase DeaD